MTLPHDAMLHEATATPITSPTAARPAPNRVTIAPDGSIAQAECTSWGLNDGPLQAEGEYPTAIACNITNGRMPHATNRVVNADIPYIPHSGQGMDAERYIANIKDGTRIIFKYFSFDGPVRLTLTLQGEGGGRFTVLSEGQEQGYAAVSGSAWQEVNLKMQTEGVCPLELRYAGERTAELLAIRFDKS